jgi:hypothetical protein
MNEKITAGHQQRKAVLYIRQSSLHQVAQIRKVVDCSTP